MGQEEMNGRRRTLLPVLLALILLEIAFFAFYGISRHYNYLTSINDLGCFDQAIWGFLHGAPFLNTILFSEPVNWLGIHFHPVLALFVPLYLITPSVVWLILAQAIALPLAALPIYFLGRRVTVSEQTAFFWAVACLFSPFLLSAASWDFHPITLTVPFIALACLAVEQGRFRLLLGCCLFILLCKEHLGLMVAGFGLVWLVRRRELFPAGGLILLGVGHFLLVFKFIMPALSPSGGHVMLAEGLGHLSRYGWLGGSFAEIIAALLADPLGIARQVLVGMEGWLYLVLLFLPVLGLPFIGIEFLIPALGDLVANLLSATPMPRSIYAYHSVTIVPLLVIAAIYGSHRLHVAWQCAAPRRAGFVSLGLTLVLAWMFFPFVSLPGGFSFWEPKRLWHWHDPALNLVQEWLPDDAALSIQANLGAHFSQRGQIFVFPINHEEADAIVLHLDSPTALLRLNAPHQIGSLGHHLQMEPREYLRTVKTALVQGAGDRILFNDPWLVILKGGQSGQGQTEISERLEMLEKTWSWPSESFDH